MPVQMAGHYKYTALVSTIYLTIIGSLNTKYKYIQIGSEVQKNHGNLVR